MKLSLKPNHLKRYKDIAMLFWKYGRLDLAGEFDLETKNDKEHSKEPAANPEELADDLEKMGPTYVKLGQLLSSRPDLLPAPYLKALARLQDHVKPFSFAEVEKIVSSELGVRISKAFSFFEEQHLAAASLGQVHRAALRDGRPVVVKVQRPEIRNQISEDFEVLEEIADFLDLHTELGKRYQFTKILKEFKTTLLHELDYQKEAGNLKTIAHNLREFPLIQIPLPVENYCTRSVLTMDFIRGTKITALSPVVRLDINGDALAEELFKAYLEQVLVDGFFHADPHPGNVFLTDDGRVALLDLGMVGHVTNSMQENLLRFLLAISDRNGEEAARIVKDMSQTTSEFEEREYLAEIGNLVAEQGDKDLDKQEVGMAIMHVARAATEHGLHVPTELTILGKTLLQLDEVGKILAPKFNPNASIRHNVMAIMRKRMLKDASPGKIFTSILEMKEFVGRLPGRVNKLLDAAANSQLEINVKTPDARHLLNGFEKIANRITMGVLLGSVILGAALLMRVPTSSFQILGYPGFAMLCFLVGIAGSAWLLLSILIKDYKDKRKRQE